MSGGIPIRDQKILWGKSGNRCAMPSCHTELVIDKTENDPFSIIGQMAHIRGEKPGAARFNTEMTEKERNCYDNLVLLCPNHHKEVDDQPNTYSVEKLHDIKKNHEKWINDSLTEEVISVTFAELGAVTNYLASKHVGFTESNYTIVPPKEKIMKNELSADTERWITTGLLQVKQVDKFVESIPDVEFGERLRQGFVKEYERVKNEGLRGDDLFDSLWDFASGKQTDFKNRAAGLAILVYLFERCEVFEK
jgi:hypothetical protein